MGFLSRKTTTAEPSTNGEPPAVADELERVEQEATEESPEIRSEQEEQAEPRDLEKELTEAEEAGVGPEGDPAAPGGGAEETEEDPGPERMMPREW